MFWLSSRMGPQMSTKEDDSIETHPCPEFIIIHFTIADHH
jgi:hypothetical protein